MRIAHHSQTLWRSRSIIGTVLTVSGLLTLAGCSSDTMVSPTIGQRPATDLAVPDTATVAISAASTHFAFWRLVPPAGGTFDPRVFDAVMPSTFSPIRASRFNIGDYTTSIPLMSSAFHLGNKETVITTTYGAGFIRVQCVVLGWGSDLAQDLLGVRTFCTVMANGQPIDQEFASLVVGNNSVSGTHAFAYADRPVAASYTPSPDSSFTTGTGPVRIQRTGVGDYSVNFGTGTPNGSTILVSAISAQAVCGVGAWKTTGVRVRCFDQNGAPVDARFNVLQLAGGRFISPSGSTTMPMAFAWADRPSAKATYVPNATHSRSSAGTISVTRTSLGAYDVRFSNLQNPFFDPESVQLTAFGLKYALCTVVSRSDEGSARLVRVQCRNEDTLPMDTRFNIALMR